MKHSILGRRYENRIWKSLFEKARELYCTYMEMEFLDISLTKDSSLLLQTIHSLSTGGFLKEKTDSPLVLKCL